MRRHSLRLTLLSLAFSTLLLSACGSKNNDTATTGMGSTTDTSMAAGGTTGSLGFGLHRWQRWHEHQRRWHGHDGNTTGQ